ncbi:MAG: hypothetical protein OER86_03195 [Phycisphaerae bacterium]|nr:hypothetical protein [Phycisphaerae bacterium]
MVEQISKERKNAYYLGMGLGAVGLLMFLSTFVIFIANFGNFDNFDSRAKTSAALAFGGMLLMMAGGAIRRVGAAGAAGSGLVLDPAQAREDLEPFSRQAGGMLQDVLDEADIRPSDFGGGSERVVMIKCQVCAQLNEEFSKYCQECGSRL